MLSQTLKPVFQRSKMLRLVEENDRFCLYYEPSDFGPIMHCRVFGAWTPRTRAHLASVLDRFQRQFILGPMFAANFDTPKLDKFLTIFGFINLGPVRASDGRLCDLWARPMTERLE